MRGRIPLGGQDPITTFWSRVRRTGDCWLWQGTVNDDGYGQFAHAGQRSAHRVAFVITFGYILPGFHVCHRCDNPPCVNPSHLFVATHVDNMYDKTRKGRALCTGGEQNRHARLTVEQVIAMRRDYLTGGYTYAVLGAKYRVSYQQAHRIVTGQRWSSLAA
jgi:hypothetical protein